MLEPLAHVSYLKGQAYLFKNHRFYPINLNQSLHHSDVVIADSAASLVLSYYNGSKQILSSDTMQMVQLQYLNFNNNLIQAFVALVESVMPTTVGQAGSRGGLFVSVLDKYHYHTEHIKFLSLVQVDALLKLADMSVSFEQKCFTKSLGFSENELIKLMDNRGLTGSQLVQIGQPLYGRLTQSEAGNFCYQLDKAIDALDIFNCIIHVHDDTFYQVLICIFPIEGHQLSLRVIYHTQTSVLEQRAQDNVIYRLNSEEANAAFISNLNGVLVDQEEMTLDDDNDLNFIIPILESVTHVMTCGESSDEKGIEIIDNFGAEDCLELTGINENLDEFTEFLRVSVREWEDTVSSVIEISGEGRMAEGIVDKTLIIQDVDLTRGSVNQEEIIGNMVASGTLILSSVHV